VNHLAAFLLHIIAEAVDNTAVGAIQTPGIFFELAIATINDLDEAADAYEAAS
jgi:hypothetical protein